MTIFLADFWTQNLHGIGDPLYFYFMLSCFISEFQWRTPVFITCYSSPEESVTSCLKTSKYPL